MPETHCACGLPLHYGSPRLRELVQVLIDRAGSPYVPVSYQGRTWMVQRHYIALHGLKSHELQELARKYAFHEVTP